MRISDWSSDVCSSDLHQAIGQHFGGIVQRGHLMHGKTSPVCHDGSGLYAGLPSPFQATRYHSLEVVDIPEGLVINATSDDGAVMGFRHAELPIHGVQFHPESIATEHGHAMLANFLRSEEHTSELQSLMRISYAVFCWKKNNK